MSTPINTALPAAATNAATTPQTVQPAQGAQALSQQDFLKIMVAQFTQQDPLASSSGGSSSSGTSDYVNELMAMTNLTTMQTMSSQQSLQLAGSLPGSTVTLSVNGSAVSGPVSGSQIQNGTLYVTIGGVQYPASEIISINQTAAQTAAAAAATTTAPASS